MRSFIFCPIVMLPFFIAHPVLGEKQDDKPPYYLSDSELDKKLTIDEKVKAPQEYLWIIYFHRVPGCETCQLMSKYVFETVKTKFADEIKTKNMVLRYKNFEIKQNAALVKKLGVKSPSLYIVEIKEGKIVKAKQADQIWSLAADKEKFIEYVAEVINKFKNPEVEKR